MIIERSRAIKAPRVEYQLLCAKKFQQYLFETDTLERLIPDSDRVERLRATFVKQYSFEKEETRRDLLDLMNKEYKNLVLKPMLEGGGNNIFGEDIKLARNIPYIAKSD